MQLRASAIPRTPVLVYSFDLPHMFNDPSYRRVESGDCEDDVYHCSFVGGIFLPRTDS